MKAKLLFMCMLIALSACKKETPTPVTTNPPANNNTDQREKFVGSFDVHMACMVGGQPSGKDFVLTIEKGSADKALILNNFIGEGYIIDATVNNDNMTIPAQERSYLGDPVMISGSGKINGKTLTYSWTIVAKSGQWSGSCTDNGDKK